MHPTIIVAGQVGYLFEGKSRGSYCFVPQDQVRFADDGKITIDEIQYFRSGWALRNMRSTSTESAGTYLFPKSDRLISDFDPAPLKRFLSAAAANSSHPFPARESRRL